MHRIYVSGYSYKNYDDIFAFDINDEKLCFVNSIRQGDNPSFLCNSKNYLYSCAEQEKGAKIYRYNLKSDEIILDKYIEVQNSDALCHLKVHNSNLYGSCYLSGDIICCDVNLENIYTIDTTVDNTMHSNAHWIETLGDVNFCANLGQDKILYWNIQNDIKYTDTKFGSGPRQIIINNNMIYSINEKNSTITLYKMSNDKLEIVKSIKLTNKEQSYAGGASLFGDNIYVCNRGADTISIVDISLDDMKVTNEVSCSGKCPRHILAINDENIVVANQHSNEIVFFSHKDNTFIEKDRKTIYGASCIIKT